MDAYDHFAFLKQMGGRLRRVAWDGSVNVTRSAQLATQSDTLAEQGRAAWAKLHSEPHGTPEWFAEWAATSIPRGCGCSGSANTLLELCPPRYDSPEEWFRWTVEFHNLVNRKLNKPELTLDEALAIWRRQS